MKKIMTLILMTIIVPTIDKMVHLHFSNTKKKSKWPTKMIVIWTAISGAISALVQHFTIKPRHSFWFFRR
jgi:hypothetical protein